MFFFTFLKWLPKLLKGNEKQKKFFLSIVLTIISKFYFCTYIDHLKPTILRQTNRFQAPNVHWAWAAPASWPPRLTRSIWTRLCNKSSQANTNAFWCWPERASRRRRAYPTFARPAPASTTIWANTVCLILRLSLSAIISTVIRGLSSK